MRFRRLVVLAIAIALPVACGGRTDDAAAPSTSSAGIDAGASEPPDASSLPPVDAATITVRPPPVTVQVLDGAADCVDIDLSTYDQSCDTAADCTNVAVGTLCRDTCSCPMAVISAADLPRYEQAIASITSQSAPTGRGGSNLVPPHVQPSRPADAAPTPAPQPPPGCHCPDIGVPRCVRGRCTP